VKLALRDLEQWVVSWGWRTAYLGNDFPCGPMIWDTKPHSNYNKAMMAQALSTSGTM